MKQSHAPTAHGKNVDAFDRKAYALRAEGMDLDAVLSRLQALRPWYLEFLKPWLPSDKHTRMLDVPCGLGNLLFALVQAGYDNVQGIDRDPAQVEVSQNLGLPATVGDGIEFVAQADPASIARIFSLDFLEHIDPHEALRFLQACQVALQPGGLLLCRTPACDGPFGSHDRHNDVTHRWGATANAATELLRLAGFDKNTVQIVQEAPVPYKAINRLRRLAFDGTTALLSGWLNFCGIGAPRVWTRSMWVIARKD